MTTELFCCCGHSEKEHTHRVEVRGRMTYWCDNRRAGGVCPCQQFEVAPRIGERANEWDEKVFRSIDQVRSEYYPTCGKILGSPGPIKICGLDTGHDGGCVFVLSDKRNQEEKS
jgi:hypothetical protein